MPPEEKTKEISRIKPPEGPKWTPAEKKEKESPIPYATWRAVKRNNHIKAVPDKSQGQPKGPQEEYKSDPKRVVSQKDTRTFLATPTPNYTSL